MLLVFSKQLAKATDRVLSTSLSEYKSHQSPFDRLESFCLLKFSTFKLQTLTQTRPSFCIKAESILYPRAKLQSSNELHQFLTSTSHYSFDLWERLMGVSFLRAPSQTFHMACILVGTLPPSFLVSYRLLFLFLNVFLKNIYITFQTPVTFFLIPFSEILFGCLRDQKEHRRQD
jgi:hypothetical protein